MVDRLERVSDAHLALPSRRPEVRPNVDCSLLPRHSVISKADPAGSRQLAWRWNRTVKSK